MAAKFFALLTNVGAAKLSNMAALGEKLEITSLAVGDGGGVSPTPSQAQTKLINERRRAPLNSLSVDEKNDSQIIAEQIIPESAGGWWIREIGLFDADGDLIAIANCPETYKATTEEGSGRTQVIRMLLTVSSTDAVTLKVDPSVVLATRQYVDDAVIEVKTYADKLVAAHEAKANPHKQYPLTANALKEMVDAGLVADVLKNLGLGEAAKRSIGSAVNQIPDMSFFS
ncbi:phage tail protein, partial [Enterobacter kobei]|uniref:phage tail protein n=1 Tax=Enterobacter kobei TaxID=208224 RepID=UPI0007B3E808